MKNQLQVDPQTTSELGYCTAPQHKSQPFIAVCPKYCGYHPSQLLCETCITQCQDQNAIIRFVPRSKPNYVQSDKMTCKTESHNNLLIVGICTISSCKNHDNELVCQMCIEQCENSQGIKLFKDQMKSYGDLSTQLKALPINNSQVGLGRIAASIKSQNHRFTVDYQKQKLTAGGLSQEQVDRLVYFLKTGRQNTLMSGFQQFDMEQKMFNDAVREMESFFSDRKAFYTGQCSTIKKVKKVKNYSEKSIVITKEVGYRLKFLMQDQKHREIQNTQKAAKNQVQNISTRKRTASCNARII